VTQLVDLTQATVALAQQATADSQRVERFTRTMATASLAIAVASLAAAIIAIIVAIPVPVPEAP